MLQRPADGPSSTVSNFIVNTSGDKILPAVLMVLNLKGIYFLRGISQAQKSPHRGGLLVWLQGAGVTKLCRSQHLVQVAQGSMGMKNPARWPGYSCSLVKLYSWKTRMHI